VDIWPGNAFPLGATYDGNGTNFSVFSEAASGVELCLLDVDEATGTSLPKVDGVPPREHRIELHEVDGHCWHGYVPGIGPGTRYGYRVHAPWEPRQGRWGNPAKLLLDPYARAVQGQVEWDPACFAYTFGRPFERNDADSAPFAPQSIVCNPYFDWGNDRSPSVPMHETVIYELHVKGFTRRHPQVPEAQRGTYAGLTHPAVIDHLLSLGVTTVELQPVHQFVHDHHLVQRGLRNYWGYNSIGFFAPHNEYAATKRIGGQVEEFKQMVRVLHEAGIEVILDVVYNHTAEGNHLGPMLAFKGIDNLAYYRVTDDPRYYMDYTGTGNTLNMRHPHVLQLVMDSLRYWVSEMHVDGFRFDLAAALARGLHDVDRLSAFFDLIQQDPVVGQVKLIAEPWDIGAGGYQVGNFPPHWSEWNGKYRDTVRDYWRGEDQTLAEFAARFTGSSDLYESDSRHPSASINFVTAHDGFTLADLVSYNGKHNEANGEHNHDGESYNRSWNCGVEGPTGDPDVLELRRRQQRNFLTTLLLSQGVPMIVAGDEMGRSQHGNNNVYCQDNETSWLDWQGLLGTTGASPQSGRGTSDLVEFTRALARLRHEHPVFHRRRWFSGSSIRGAGAREIAWFRPDGSEMQDEDWETGYAKVVGVALDGNAIPYPGPRGEHLTDDVFLLLFNAHHEPLPWTLPSSFATLWTVVVDTTTSAVGAGESYKASEQLLVAARSVVVLQGDRDD
jgi:isoamylase